MRVIYKCSEALPAIGESYRQLTAHWQQATNECRAMRVEFLDESKESFGALLQLALKSSDSSESPSTSSSTSTSSTAASARFTHLMFVVDDMLFVRPVRLLTRWLDVLSDDASLLAIQLRLHTAVARSQTANNAPCKSSIIPGCAPTSWEFCERDLATLTERNSATTTLQASGRDRVASSSLVLLRGSGATPIADSSGAVRSISAGVVIGSFVALLEPIVCDANDRLPQRNLSLRNGE